MVVLTREIPIIHLRNVYILDTVRMGMFRLSLVIGNVFQIYIYVHVSCGAIM